jgi:hypothetical protein
MAASTGSIDLTVQAEQHHSRMWSNGATTQDLTNIPAGTYNVTSLMRWMYTNTERYCDH